MSSSTRIEWMWKSNEHPWNSSQKEEWCSYSDVETAIVEEAYQKKLSEALIDDYHINFKNSVQISNSNQHNQRPVKRVERGRSTSEPRLREARFMPSPIYPSTPFAEQKFFLGFIGEIFEMFGVNGSDTLAEPANRRLMIKKTAEGIITEGKLLGKQKEAEWMAQQLLNVIDGTDQQVWECCAHLYTMESFLYQKMNEYMRLCGDEKNKALWKSKVKTFGPFGYLLQMLTYSKNYNKFYVYRGANLSDDLIEKFRQNIGAYLMFPAFTSTSRNRTKAEQFGNVLFIIHTSSMSGNDVVPFSDYPDEEETLLNADFNFYIRSCTVDKTKNKWIINISSWKDD
ncbi:unnamed protein product [Rotaria sp. Silwood2]|nr:unnamed protein product [Rotaria sp. Silwood2]CAF3962765.1 unnamed protein product [Rotaria sp. Silwood2]